MFSNLNVYPTIPAKNLGRARKFYEEKLGLKPHIETPGALFYKTADSYFQLYETQFAGTAKNTAASLVINKLEKAVNDLKSKGVSFEKFDMPGVEWKGEIAVMGNIRSAWFKDSEDNILALSDVGPEKFG